MKRNVPVTEIMNADPFAVHLGEKLSTIRKTMAERGFHHVPVVSGKKLVGMVTSYDLMRLFGEGGDAREADAYLDHSFSIGEAMTTGLTTVSKHDTVRKAAEILGEGKFHALPVVEGEELIGIITSTDLIRYLVDQY